MKKQILLTGEPGNGVGPVRLAGLDEFKRPEVEEHFYLKNPFMAAKVRKALADMGLNWDGRLAERDDQGHVQFVKLSGSAPKLAAALKTAGTKTSTLIICGGCGWDNPREGYEFLGTGICEQCIDLATDQAAQIIARSEILRTELLR